jgi:hypothetical protein
MNYQRIDYNRRVDIQNIVATPVAAYVAQGVRFDGTNDWLSRASPLSGVVDGQLGILSFWFKMMGGDGSVQIFLEDGSISGALQFFRNGSNQLNVTVGAIGQVTSTSTFVAGMGWKHALAAWNAASLSMRLYIQDVSEHSITAAGGTADYTHTDFFIGARSGGSLILNAEVAEFYFNTAEFLDISVAANRRKFISAGGAPVNLGADGSTPTGNAPAIYLSGPVATWHTNDGSGGGFTVTGALTAASSNPP